MLVVDRLEAVDLERHDDEFVATFAGVDAKLSAAIGEAFAVVEAGDRIGGREDDRPPLLLGAHLGFVLKVDVAPPAEQDQRDIERQCRAREADSRPILGVAHRQVVEEGAAVPDEHHHGDDEHRQDENIAPRIG